jgi:hypothetical protein
MSTLRARSLEYIEKNGNFMTYQDVAAGLKEPPQRVRTALNDASNEGYLSFGRDDVTGQGGYSLTSKGAARLKNGRQMVNGRSAAENKKACDEREAAAHVMSAPPAVDDPVDEDLPPQADPVALAMANKMLADKVANLEADLSKQRNLLGSKTEHIVELENRVDILRTNIAGMLSDWSSIRQALDVVTHEEALQAIAELNSAYEERTQRQLDQLGRREPIGYACMADEATIMPTEIEAMDHALRVMREGVISNLHVVAILNTAEISVKWAR